MMNMMNMMKQAQNIQKKLKETQDELNKMDISGEAGNGSVKVICDGKGLFKSIIDTPSLKAAIHKLPDLSFTISLKILFNLEEI